MLLVFDTNKYLAATERLKRAEEIILLARHKNVVDRPNFFCKDPADVKFLSLALEAGVDCIVSGDIHLRELNPLQGIPVLSPAEFLKWLK